MSLPMYQGHKTPSALYVPPIVSGGDWGCIVRDLQGDYRSINLTRIQFHPRKVKPFTNFAEVTI